MDKETKKKIKNMVLILREMFEKEIENGLNRYGIYIDKTWKDGRSLRHMDSEELDNKKRVEAFIRRQESTGLSQSQATKEFIKEVAYTWINRLIGLKCMETRGLTDEEVITIRDKFGGRSERHRNFIKLEHLELAHTSDGGLTACLMSVFRDVTEEIKILFDPNNEYSLIVPRYRCLKDAIDLINNSVDYDVYKEDEFLGWVYQYFQTKEKDRIFDEINKKKKKISGSDIIPVTSLYTEKYMVRFLVENSLGVIWMEMYPDSDLYKNWEYFVKDPNNTTREPKPIKEIKFLDPACGSGHFLLYAFDLFYQMYKEEGVVPEKDIPEYILRYNLHGIDIDLRSVQLSALSLWMKARSKNPDIEIKQMNLVAANAIMLDGERLNEFLNEFGNDELVKELVKTIWKGLQNVGELGSLLKVEEQIDETIARVKRQTRIGEEWEKEQFTWEQWKQRIMDKLREYYEKAAETFDINKQIFANETIKGLSFIDLISQKYDVVATNPPYMGKRNMGRSLKKYFQTYFYKNRGDLYTVFMDRCKNLLAENGYLSMIAQHTFMFISSYQHLREQILNFYKIRAIVHLGPHAFGEITGEKVNNAMFSFKLEEIARNRDKNLSTFLRLVEAPNKERKLRGVISKTEQSKGDFFRFRQERLRIINGYPFSYWMPDKIFDIFKEKKGFENYADVRQGIITGNNELYLRYFWEINPTSDSNWKYYSKAGQFTKYFSSPDLVINWSDEYKNLYTRIRDEKYHFREAVYSPLMGTERFSARLLERDSLFDVATSGIFSNEDLVYYFLGLLNSSLTSYILRVLNPTLSFPPETIKMFPIEEATETKKKIVLKICRHCVSIKRSFLQFIINDREFKQPAIMWGKGQIEGVE